MNYNKICFFEKIKFITEDSKVKHTRITIIYKANGKQSTVNKSLDGSPYPSEKLAHSALGKKIFIVKSATAYTWDWYCHLVVDRASLKWIIYISNLNAKLFFLVDETKWSN
jgi:hypothetical protein